MRSERGLSLVELVVVLGIMATLMTLSMGPFIEWYQGARLEERASTLQDTFKWAQTRAVTGGQVDLVNGKLVAKRLYLAVNTSTGGYRVVEWVDADADKRKEPSEFALLQEGSIVGAWYGAAPSVKREVRSEGSSVPGTTFSVNACPAATDAPLLAGFQCARLDGKGFLTEDSGNADVYITNGAKSCAVSINPAGIPFLYRWSDGGWQLVR